MTDLARFKCVPCRGDEPALEDNEIKRFQQDVPDWEVTEVDGEKRLKRQFKFKNFSEALDFTNQVGRVAEEQDHHPALLTEWGKVTVTWWTHKIKGLHQNDFIMAAKTNELFQSRSGGSHAE